MSHPLVKADPKARSAPAALREFVPCPGSLGQLGIYQLFMQLSACTWASWKNETDQDSRYLKAWNGVRPQAGRLLQTGASSPTYPTCILTCF